MNRESEDGKGVLQEVFASTSAASGDSTLILGNGAEDAKLGVQILAYVHDGRYIATAVTVIWCRPNGNHRLLREVILVAFVDQLMSTSNELQTIDMIELSCNLITKEPASTTGRNCPSLNILRVTPDKVTESTLMRYLLSTSNNTDLVNGANLRAEATVNAQNLTVNDSSEDEEVKNLAARLPDRSVAVLLLTLLVEAVDLSNLARFVVTSDESNLVGIHCLEAHQQGECLQAEIAAVDEITKEDEVLVAASGYLIDTNS